MQLLLFIGTVPTDFPTPEERSSNASLGSIERGGMYKLSCIFCQLPWLSKSFRAENGLILQYLYYSPWCIIFSQNVLVKSIHTTQGQSRLVKMHIIHHGT